MEYVIMSLEEAKRVAKKDAIVLVAKQDLEKDCNIGFEKKKFGDCHNILEEAVTIAKICDEFANQLRIFSETQSDIINYSNKGKLTTILFSKLE